MAESEFVIRQMTRSELDIAVDWAAAEGWNPGRFDADCFFAADPLGFFIGLVDNQPVATISVVKYDELSGFVGFYMVKPEFRGRGYGLRLWDFALNGSKELCLGLDGVVAQQGNYRKSGFNPAWRNIRCQGQGGGPLPDNLRVVPLATVPLAEICAYDRSFFPADRRRFLESWLAQPQSTALGIRDWDGRLPGYGVLRACRVGYKFGPLFADRPGLAEELFLALKAHAPETASVFLDVPEINAAARALVERHRLATVFATARMYRGACPKLSWERMYGITTFELG
ncbi:MAG: GNAT family N-acetyltransferase [Deltaproteobacteria bacterium]|nr:GNAT family N-acetyltransferase [Deltaproteobacteria bacterium]